MNVSTAADETHLVSSADATANDRLRFGSATASTNSRSPSASQLIEATDADEFVALELEKLPPDTRLPDPDDLSKPEEPP